MKGNCAGCDRKDVPMATKQLCSACYPLGVKFKGNLDKVRAFRKEHPVLARKTSGGG